ncbi:Beta-galactosidase [Sesamum alatum]|uniref:Beta-galactosidase n=1 Tax=Sesamum alatum TaxID=300844 RepID=A0AAE2CEM8_9LAMI|nr:Beta-galactosidase [Sesamum alatum]
MPPSFKFLALAVILLCPVTFNLSADAADVSYDGRALKIDGQRRIIISGSIHYPRSTPEMWPSLIKKAKEGGLNAIETYVFWNAHEPLYRQYDFSGNLDLLRFLKVIQDEGLYAILRIGPYVCAEWNYGGFPVWLKSIPNMTFRTENDAFMYQMKNFTTLIVDKVKGANLFASEGGPIILAQIENEYGNVIGSYGNEGKSYINWCANFAETLNIGVPWIMCQESDAPPSMINTCNGWYCDQFSPNRNIPKMWTENWSGWYKNWGGKDPHRTAEDLAFAVGRFFQYGGTLQNYYMYHGGTNFGRTAGGPYITTSYDYDAPLNEYGIQNQPKWGHLKKLHDLIMSMEKILTYGKATNKDYGRMMSSTVFEYNGTRVCFLGNANNRDAITIDFEGKSYTTPAWSVSILPDCVNVVYNTAKVNTQKSVVVKKLPVEAAPKRHYDLEWRWRAEHFEHLKTSVEKSGPMKGVTYANQLLDQKLVTNDTSDYLWYMTSVDINEDDPIWGEEVSVRVQCDCHILHAFFNGKHIGSKWVTNGQYNFVFERSAKLKRGMNSLSLLSVTVGLQNYGAHFDKMNNGILGPVKLVAPNSLEKDLTSNKWAYKVGLNGLERRLQEVDTKYKRNWQPNVPFDRMFVWYKTTFKTPKGEDPVVLDLWGLGKGTAWVNGHDIGRYWPSFLADDNGCVSSCDYRGAYTGSKCLTNCGKSSQRWYHVPRSFLNDEDNTLVLFEELGGNPTFISVQTVTVQSASAHAYEGNTLELSCHGRLISHVNFASFGNGTYGSLEKGSCNSRNSLSVVKQACIGKESCAIDASEQTFGRSRCDSPMKSLAVEVQC